jgi:glyoxylase-like metal-dependent hydrolase (beta-lactamase superfamily II)
VIITHGHEDHAGSAAAVRQWGNVEVLAHRDDVATIRGERARAHPTLTPAERPLFDQVTATMPVLPPCAVDTDLIDGDTIDFGQGAHIIATPGHTDGSIAIWLPAHRVLFTGDIVANGSSGLLLGPFNTDRAQARESVVRLAQTPTDVVGLRAPRSTRRRRRRNRLARTRSALPTRSRRSARSAGLVQVTSRTACVVTGSACGRCRSREKGLVHRAVGETAVVAKTVGNSVRNGPRELVSRLTRWVEAAPWASWLELSGSLGRDAGDEHSDVDAGIGEQGRLDEIEAAVHEFAPVGAR